jgi:Alternative complex III, ActD subunit
VEDATLMASRSSAMYGLFEQPEAAQLAYAALRRAGIAESDITVISSEPFEHFEFSHRDRSLALFRLAGVGGVVGFIIGVSLTAGTERAWPINVGNMPILAWWPNLVIIFELTMLSAILTTVVSLLVTARLPSRAQSLYDPAVSDGKILVGVPLTADRMPDAIRRALDAGGALAVKTADFQS